jgi:hypothetical protein
MRLFFIPKKKTGLQTHRSPLYVVAYVLDNNGSRKGKCPLLPVKEIVSKVYSKHSEKTTLYAQHVSYIEIFAWLNFCKLKYDQEFAELYMQIIVNSLQIPSPS